MSLARIFISFILIQCSSLITAQLLSTDFENQPIGAAYTRPVWQSDGFSTGDWDNALATRTSIDTLFSVSGEKSLRIEYPEDQYGTSTSNGTGAQVELFLSPENEYYMSYFFRFSKNFSWGGSSEGGKLPGLTGRKRCGDDFFCDGTDGFSARFMWRRNGKGVLYLYHMDMPEKYGEDFDLRYPEGEIVYFEKGKWYHIAERVKMNSDGSTYDGIVQVWINGKEVLSLENIRFQSNNDMIDNFYMSTFHGGNNANWAPTDTCFMWYDDITISTSYDDVSYVECSNPDAAFFGENCNSAHISESGQIRQELLYPNPASVFVQLESEYDKIQIYNSAGKIMLTDINSRYISVETLPEGIYVMLLTKGAQQLSETQVFCVLR